jgi:polyisoprenoid-binding protein YceI
MSIAIDHSRARTLADGVWSIDPRRSELGFAVKDMWGLRTVRGRFATFEGRVHAGQGALSIDAASLATGDQRRDRHLRSGSFFAVERHPRIGFTATAVTDDTVTGELAIGSARIPLEIPVRMEHLGEDVVRLHAETAVSREAAGLGWNTLGMIRGDALLHARLTLTR